MQKNCVECHRSGTDSRRFALTDYDEIVGWADMIEEVVRRERMPPWHADPKFGHFQNDRRLSDADKELIYAWVKSGAPEGNRADLPKPVEYPEGWQLAQARPDHLHVGRAVHDSRRGDGSISVLHRRSGLEGRPLDRDVRSA